MKALDSRTCISLKNVLFATDFSKCSSAALPYALSFVRRNGGKLYAAHVMAPDAYTFVPDASCPAVVENQVRKLQEEANDLEERLHGIPHLLLFREGKIWDELSDIIEKNEIDLAVIGTHGRTGVKKLLRGSVAEEILRKAPCPVLIVGPQVSVGAGGKFEPDEILYTTDFSLESLAAAPYAVSLAQEHRAQLTLLYVLERPDAGMRDPELTAASLLDRMQALIPREAGVRWEPKYLIEYGSPVDRILESAERRNAGLIVLGVRRAGNYPAVATHLAWTTAHRIVSQARCPVLTVCDEALTAPTVGVQLGGEVKHRVGRTCSLTALDAFCKARQLGWC